jgi:glycyl-tRNA synthetase beta chain
VSEQADFLVELGTEELPPKALAQLSRAFADNFAQGLADSRLSYGSIEPFATPRRLALRVRGLSLTQPDEALEQRGPPLKVAFDERGEPTRAALAFAQRCGVAVGALQRLQTADGAWLLHKSVQRGKTAAECLPDITRGALDALPVPKRMRWGSSDAAFVRPVHWLVMLLGEAVVPAEILGQPSGRTTYGHRVHGGGPIELAEPGEYQRRLEAEGFVVADFQDRRNRVRTLTEEAAGKLGGQGVYDDKLLDEVAALVEWPVAVIGRFDPVYLELPEEAMIATLQGHQRFFPVRDGSGALMDSFIAMANIRSTRPEEVRSGFERVVRPRLADAAFFFATDRRESLSARRPGLRQVLFQARLGSVFDVTERLRHLCGVLADTLGADRALAQRAAELSRSDLITAMVGEFPELQGVMGMYYARHDGEPEELARALAEQYRPRYAGDGLPETLTGQCLAIASKIDLITGIFAIGQRPSGTRDPYGLRRAALGLVRLAIECELEIDLPFLVRTAAELLPVAPLPEEINGEIYDYVVDRLAGYYREQGGAVTPEIFQAVASQRPVSLLDFDARARALARFAEHESAQSLAAANKRVANILRKSEEQLPTAVDSRLLREPAEQALYATLQALQGAVERALREGAYGRAMTELAETREVIDRFFDDVMVNVEETELRLNRLCLLRDFQRLYNGVGDISCLHVG